MARLASGKASRTARITAAMRHRDLLGGARPLVFEDRLAHLFLDLRSALWWPCPRPARTVWSAGFAAPFALSKAKCWRALATSNELAARLHAGLDQVIVLGAGFDTTALRHVDSRCRFFEVGHPATQADKRAILSRRPDLCANLTFVPVDFGRDDLADALLAADFDSSRPALVSWLGVTMYLEQRVTVGTLVTLRRILAPGSIMIFEAYPRRDVRRTAHVRRRSQRTAANGCLPAAQYHCRHRVEAPVIETRRRGTRDSFTLRWTRVHGPADAARASAIDAVSTWRAGPECDALAPYTRRSR